MMQVGRYIPESYHLLQVARMEEIGVGKAILGALRTRIGEVQAEMELRPSLNDQDLTKDARYQMGLIAGLKWLEKLQQDAREYVGQLEEQEKERERK